MVANAIGSASSSSWGARQAHASWATSMGSSIHVDAPRSSSLRSFGSTVIRPNAAIAAWPLSSNAPSEK